MLSSCRLWGKKTGEGVDSCFPGGLVRRRKTNVGKTVWKTNRAVTFTNPDKNARKSYCTPIVIEADGRRELVDRGAEAAMGYDAVRGKEL